MDRMKTEKVKKQAKLRSAKKAARLRNREKTVRSKANAAADFANGSPSAATPGDAQTLSGSPSVGTPPQ